MTIALILNIVFAAFVVIAIVGLLAASIVSDRAMVAGLRARRASRARTQSARAPQRRFGPAHPIS